MAQTPQKGGPLTLVPCLPENSSVKVIGLGGVGSIVARYGAIFLSSLNVPVRLVLIDGDEFEPKNAARMYFSRQGNKAEVVCEDLGPYLDGTQLGLVPVGKYIRSDNAEQLLHEGDVALLCVDNHATRKLVNDHAVKLDNIVVISGGNDGVGQDGSGVVRRGTYGNCQIYVRKDGKDVTPSLTRYHPEIDKPADHPEFLKDEPSCIAIALASAPQILFANFMVASAMLNALWLYCCQELHYEETAFDVYDALMRPISLSSDTKKEKSG